MTSQVNFVVKIIAGFLLIALFYNLFFDFHLQSKYTSSSSSSSEETNSCPVVEDTKVGEERCATQFEKYVPSELELKWMKSSITWMWQFNFCTAQKSQASEIDMWLKTCGKLNSTRSHKLPESDQDFLHANKVFSKFIYKKTCGTETEMIEKWIEPLAFSLRHPQYNSGCTPPGKKYGYSTDHILLDSNVVKKKRKQSILMDFSALTFTTGPEGPPQKYFYNSYKARGVNFTRVMLWDANVKPDAEIFKDVPSDWYPFYQYYNTPVPSEKTDPKNPFNFLKVFTTPDDFVTIKLDLNTPAIENSFISQIVEDPEVSSRIDEFFFEHHVNFDHLNEFWGNIKDPNMYLPDSYKLFSKLRHLGIRAHGWI